MRPHAGLRVLDVIPHCAIAPSQVTRVAATWWRVARFGYVGAALANCCTTVYTFLLINLMLAISGSLGRVWGTLRWGGLFKVRAWERTAGVRRRAWKLNALCFSWPLPALLLAVLHSHASQFCLLPLDSLPAAHTHMGARLRRAGSSMRPSRTPPASCAALSPWASHS